MTVKRLRTIAVCHEPFIMSYFLIPGYSQLSCTECLHVVKNTVKGTVLGAFHVLLHYYIANFEAGLLSTVNMKPTSGRDWI